MGTPFNRPRYHSILSVYSPLTGKDILVFCDGTGKDGTSAKGDPTNIWQLYKLAISPESQGPSGSPATNGILPSRQKEIVYLPGVGAGTRKNPLNLLSRIFGTTIVDNILAAYLHVAKHYVAGDHIYLFGYSRGAFVARKVASLIYRIGIIRDKEEVLNLWGRYEQPVPWNLVNSGPRSTMIPIKSLVVWDTVGAIHPGPNQKRMEKDILDMPDDELPLNVKHAFHVVAFHENRRLFRVTLFDPRSDPKKLKEVWFPGAHSDVGGGGSKKSGLPNISLAWVIGELQATCSLTISNDQLDYPVEIENLAPSNAYHESPPWKRIVDKCETRLPLLKPTSLVHETVLYLRNLVSTNLDPRFKPTADMLTVNDLGPIGWNIKACLVARNKFEILKQANAHAKKKLKEQAAHYRNRISSMYMPGTSRPPATAISKVSDSHEYMLRSRSPGSIVQTPEPSTLRPATHAHTTNSRSQVKSHDPRAYNNLPSQAVTPVMMPQTSRNQVTPLGITSRTNPSILPPPTERVRATSTRSRGESYVAPRLQAIPPGQSGQSRQTTPWGPIATPQQERNAPTPAGAAPLRPSPSAHSHLTARMRTESTRSRTESRASPQLSTIPSGQVVSFPAAAALSQPSRSGTPSASASPSRTGPSVPNRPTTHAQASTRFHAEPQITPRPHDMPSTEPRFRQAAPIAAPPHGNARNLVGATPYREATPRDQSLPKPNLGSNINLEQRPRDNGDRRKKEEHRLDRRKA